MIPRFCIFLGFLLISFTVFSGEVEVVDATVSRGSVDWNASVTLRHADAGWNHYADAWRIVDGQGKELGKRVLHHPHDKEQPFTRSLHNVEISPETKVIFIEAHDKVHGWSARRMKVKLDHLSGRGKAVGIVQSEPAGKTKDKEKKESGATQHKH